MQRKKLEEYEPFTKDLLDGIHVCAYRGQIDVMGFAEDMLGNVLELFQRTTIAFRIDGKRMLLYWNEGSAGCRRLPVAMTGKQLAPGCLEWLKTIDYGPEPDHEGHNIKGWRCFNEAWGHVNQDWRAFAALEPAWIMCGK